MATTPAKRPLDSNHEDSDAKRVRSDDGTATTLQEDEKLRKRQETAAKIAALKAKMNTAKTQNGGPGLPPMVSSQQVPPSSSSGGSSGGSGTDENQRKKEEIQRKIAEMKAKVAVQKQGKVVSTPSGMSSPLQPGQADPIEEARRNTQRRVAEMKAKLAAHKHGTAAQTTNGTNLSSQVQEVDPIAEARRKAADLAKRPGSKSASKSGLAPPPPPPRQDAGNAARGGLGIGLHPSLMGDSKASATRPNGSKSNTPRGNKQADAPRANPYLEADNVPPPQQADGYDAALITKKAGERKSRNLVFNEKGKFMAQANAIRQQAHMDEMKKRIAEEARKTEIEEAGDKAFLVPVPPEVEWWDEGIVDNIYDETGLVSDLIVHPVMLQAPQDKLQPAPKPLMLTPKEQKKLRRQRRLADLKEEQAKIRLGLVAPPPPKVKKSNMMRVLGEQAVKDPTAVEARVNKEIAQRASDHAQANADRALTKEQRAEKLKQQQAGDEARGVKIAVFRIDDLSSGKHRYQMDINAKQNSLTGIVVLHPEMNLVIVEGGARSLTLYKKLLLHRIRWVENSPPLAATATANDAAANSKPSTFTGANDGTKSSDTNKAAQWLNPLDETGQLKDLARNRCRLVWEGDEPQRCFKRWGSKACETDGEARDVLSRSKMENMWTLARSMGDDVD
nr:u4/u5/u6 small nuclear ribonucleoprotein prp3 [Quercus suber]